MEFWKLFPNGVPQRAKSLLWVCDQLETVENVLKECPLHPAERDLLRKVSPMLDPRILIDTKNGIVTIVKPLDSLPQLLCWWFAWLEQLIKVLLCVNNYYQSTALCTAGFKRLLMENLGQSNIQTYNTRWYCCLFSLIETNALKSMSSLYAMLFYKFVCNYLMQGR